MRDYHWLLTRWLMYGLATLMTWVKEFEKHYYFCTFYDYNKNVYQTMDVVVVIIESTKIIVLFKFLSPGHTGYHRRNYYRPIRHVRLTLTGASHHFHIQWLHS